MNLNRRQRTFLIIFFIGLVALVIDRTIIRPQGGPGAASAESFVFSDDSTPSLDDIPPPGDESVGPGVAERLGPGWSQGPADLDRMRDPFALPASWLEAAGEAQSDPGAAFAERHRLTAVVNDGRVSYALVDDHFIAPGQRIDDFILVSVGDGTAVFERDGNQAVLELQGK